MTKKVGRVLSSVESIHHINGNNKDNRIDNLILCNNHKEHQKKYHSSPKKRIKLKMPLQVKTKKIVDDRTKMIMELDDCTCIYCGGKFEHEKLLLDYIIPVAYGGSQNIVNRAVACTGCSWKKGNFLPKDFVTEINNHRKGTEQLKVDGRTIHIYQSLSLYYFCADVFQYIPERNYYYVA